MHHPIDCLADGLTPGDRTVTLMETFNQVSEGLSAVEAVRARRQVIETIAREVADFYTEWDHENPGSYHRDRLPQGEHLMVRVAQAFARASLPECQWLFHSVREMAQPDYCNPHAEKLSFGSGFEEKLEGMASQAQEFQRPGDLPVPSWNFTDGIMTGMTYALMAKNGVIEDPASEKTFELAEKGDWDGVWRILWKNHTGLFHSLMEKTAALSEEKREWEKVTEDTRHAVRNLWSAMTGVFRHVPGPADELARRMTEQLSRAAMDAYGPSNPAMFQALLTWQVTRERHLVGFVPREKAQQAAWRAIAPLLEDGEFSEEFRDFLVFFEEERPLSVKRPAGETEQSFRAWEAEVLRERLEAGLDAPGQGLPRRKVL